MLTKYWRRTWLKTAISSLLIIQASLLSFSLYARGTYQEASDFLNEVFNGHPPQAQSIWLTGLINKNISRILQHPPHQLRIRYWANNQLSAWILEEIGKEKPITVGIVIKDQQISHLKVLRFLEDRGDEVRHPFFTLQFQQAQLTTKTELELNKAIDGISGATLSVRAVTKLARLALYLNQQRQE